MGGQRWAPILLFQRQIRPFATSEHKAHRACCVAACARLYERYMATFLDQIEPVKQAGLAELRAAADPADLEQARINYLGASGKFTALMKQLGSLPKEAKPAAGKAINAAKAELESVLAQRREELDLKAALP